MFARRILAFLFETFILLPISLVINVCAILPFMAIHSLFQSDGPEFTNILFFGIPLSFVAGWGIAFFLNKLRLRLKGKTTDDYYEVEYQRVTSRVVERYYGYGIETHVHNGRRIESENTGWGIIGILLCFIAFPLQLVASLASCLALVIPVIYSTSRRLPDGIHFSVGNQILHILFDFVIITFLGERLTPKFDQKSVLWAVCYIATPIAALSLASLVADLINVASIGAIAAISMIAMLFLMFITVALLIKYLILTFCFYDGVRAKVYAVKLALSSLAPAVFIVLALVFQ